MTKTILTVSALSLMASATLALADGHQSRQLFVIAAGPHPTALLYGYVVESLLPPLEAALAAGKHF